MDYDFHRLCKRGNITEILKDLENNFNINKINDGLSGACYGGHKEIVELLISRSAPLGTINYGRGLVSACASNNRDIAILMIKYIDKYLIFKEKIKILKTAVEFSIINKRKEMILFLMINGATIDNYSIDLNLDDIYYLYQNKISLDFLRECNYSDEEKYKGVSKKCYDRHSLFLDTMKEILQIDALAEFVASF